MNKQFNILILNAFDGTKENTDFIKICIEQKKGNIIDKYINYIDNIIENIHKQIIEKNRCILFGKKYTGEQTDELEYNLNIKKLFDFINEYYISDNLEKLIFCGSNKINSLFAQKFLNEILKNKRLDIIQKLDKNQTKLLFSEYTFLENNYIKYFSIEECSILFKMLNNKNIELNFDLLFYKNMIMAILLNYQNDYQKYISKIIERTSFTLDKDILQSLVNLIEDNKISIDLVQDDINILDYYLQKNNIDKIKMFSKKVFDRYILAIVNNYYDLLIKIANDDRSFIKKLSQSEKILEYYLEKKDKDLIKQFESLAFTNDIINKHSEIIYEIFKDNIDFFSAVLSENTSLLICCLNKKEYNYLKKFKSKAFTEEIIKENLEKILEHVNLDWIEQTISFSSEVLLYCLKNKKYDYITKFSLTAFKNEIINDYISIIFEKFKNDNIFFSNILAHSPIVLIYCLENNKIDYLKKFYSSAFTKEILEKYMNILFEQIKKNQNNLLLQLSDNDIVLDYCLKEKEYELVKKFLKTAFTEEISKKYTKIIIDIFKDETSFTVKFSDNKIILNYCLENIEYNKYLKNFSNSVVFNMLINCDDERKTKRYFVKLLGIKDEQSEEMLNYILQRFNSLINKSDNINFTDIIQYGFNSSKYPNWKVVLSSIIEPNGEIQLFVSVMEYLLKNYYSNDGDKKKNLSYFFEILENYNRYKILLSKMLNNKTLTNEEKGKLKYIFSLDSAIKIENIDDVEEILIALKNSITSSSSIDRIKYVLNTLLFGKGYLDDVLNKINTEKLKILKFNNQNNNEVLLLIEQLLIYTSIMEEIQNCKDRESLKEMLDKCEIKETLEIFSILSQLPELERTLYEIESEKSLTKIENLTDELITKKDGIKYIDLSDKQYILYAHVMSPRESISEVCHGETSNGKHNFICLTPISHRNQKYFTSIRDKIIFAYDHICKGSFICSSDIDISSNGLINEGSMDLKSKSLRGQKGILETSEARFGGNAEALFFREGLRPCGIIITSDRELQGPTNEELEIANKYNLNIIFTQKVMETIQNPKPLNLNKNKVDVDNSKEKLAHLNTIKAALLNKFPQKEKKKKYGIITDIHAMYEPALACLEDMRKKGITEIYSLGDNIGVGPNPREVLDLLKEYNVKSLKGNHELYIKASKEGKTIKDILPKHIAAHRTKNQVVANWTGKQIDDVEDYPISIELTSSSGQKATLIHSTDKSIYNEDLPDLNKSDLILQGHSHFENKNGNIITLRAAGIGDRGSGLASYTILKEDDSGNFICEKVEVPFDRENLLHDINESLLPDKTDVSVFLGKKR